MTASTLQSSQYMRTAEESEPIPAWHHSFRKPLAWAAVVSAIGFLAWIFYRQDDWIAAAATLLVGLGAVNGFRRGFLGIVVTVAAIAVATQFSWPIGRGTEDFFTERLGTTGLLNRGIAVVSAGVLLYLGFNVFVSSMLWVVLGNREKPMLIGRILGMVFGAAQWTLALAFLLGGIVLLEPTLQESNSLTVSPQVTDQMGSTCLRPWVERYNPLLLVPELQIAQVEEAKRHLETLSDPQKVQQLLAHPTVQELREDPKLEAILQELRDDPEITEFLNSPSGIDTPMIARLLQNETVLKLSDQPKFRKILKAAIAELHREAETSDTEPDEANPTESPETTAKDATTNP